VRLRQHLGGTTFKFNKVIAASKAAAPPSGVLRKVTPIVTARNRIGALIKAAITRRLLFGDLQLYGRLSLVAGVLTLKRFKWVGVGTAGGEWEGKPGTLVGSWYKRVPGMFVT
jgi:hypothetical protein